MNVDPNKTYMMPLMMGPLDNRKDSGGAVYRKVETVALQYETSPEAIAALLPDCYQPTKKPIVTVAFIYNDGVDFMAGRGYRIATVMVTARYDGERDHTEGSFALVMFEDDTLPIVLGRERLGVPKLYADISPIRTLPDGHLRCEASLWGHLLFGIDVDPLVKQDDAMIAAANESPRGAPLLGFKYISSPDGPPDAAYPLSTPSDRTLVGMSLGRSGRFFFGNPGLEDIGVVARAIDALGTLPVQQVVGTSRSRSSSVLRADLCRRLR
jgi:hypothetical protein